MKALKGAFALALAWGAMGLAFPATDPGGETQQAGQAAADVLRDEAGADGAFMAAGLMKETSNADNLASALQYPSDEVVVLGLKGSEIRQAFERSLSLYPHPNSSALHISSEFEVTFQASAEPGKRVVGVTVGSGKLDDNKTYNIAMPAQLGRGALGYFKIWDKTKIVRWLQTPAHKNKTAEQVLSGKKLTATKSRWIAQP